ncbi:MAG TPA: hypothetical protein PKU80_01350 [Candidatus Limiplasma sp.]|nr:hypothetical protein [Candidatus Limiplasma sp.]HRX08872.1 hypothetical protein [Candidatus Limiplasma sp.]
MKKLTILMLIVLMLCNANMVASAAEIPLSAKDFFADRIAQGYTITRWFATEESDYAQAILSKDGENRLFVLKKNGDSFGIEVSSSKAIYQGDVLPEIFTETNAYFYLTYLTASGEKEVYHFQRDDAGTWNLYAY